MISLPLFVFSLKEKDLNHCFKIVDPKIEYIYSLEPKAGGSNTLQPVGKRKRSSNEGETTGKVAKKQKCSQAEDNVSTAAPESPRRESRTRRSQRSRLQEGEGMKKKSSLKPAPTSKEDDSVVIIDDVILVEDTRKKGEEPHDNNVEVWL